MEPDQIREIATEELEERSRDFGRGSRPGRTSTSNSRPGPEDAPVDPALEQQWLEQAERARRDLELRSDAGGDRGGTQ